MNNDSLRFPSLFSSTGSLITRRWTTLLYPSFSVRTIELSEKRRRNERSLSVWRREDTEQSCLVYNLCLGGRSFINIASNGHRIQCYLITSPIGCARNSQWRVHIASYVESMKKSGNSHKYTAASQFYLGKEVEEQNRTEQKGPSGQSNIDPSLAIWLRFFVVLVLRPAWNVSIYRYHQICTPPQ